MRRWELLPPWAVGVSCLCPSQGSGKRFWPDLLAHHSEVLILLSTLVPVPGDLTSAMLTRADCSHHLCPPPSGHSPAPCQAAATAQDWPSSPPSPPAFSRGFPMPPQPNWCVPMGLPFPTPAMQLEIPTAASIPQGLAVLVTDLGPSSSTGERGCSCPRVPRALQWEEAAGKWALLDCSTALGSQCSSLGTPLSYSGNVGLASGAAYGAEMRLQELGKPGLHQTP